MRVFPHLDTVARSEQEKRSEKHKEVHDISQDLMLGTGTRQTWQESRHLNVARRCTLML